MTMIGVTIGAWVVREVLYESLELRRYKVEDASGRAGAIDVAAAGTWTAANMLNETRARPDVIDRGVDTFGNAFVVFTYQPHMHVAQPMLPGPAMRPAAASSSTTKTLIIAGSVVGGVILLSTVGYFAFKKKSSTYKSTLYVRANGEWDRAACDAAFKIKVDMGRRGTVEALGKQTITDALGEATLELTPEQIGSTETISVRGFVEGESEGTTTVYVTKNERSGPLYDGKTSSGKGVNDRIAAKLDGREINLSNAYGDSMAVPDGKVRFTFFACGLEPGTTQQGAATVEVTATAATITLDPSRHEWESVGAKPLENLTVPIALSRSSGEKLALELTGSITLGNAGEMHKRIANIAKEPFVDAPAVDSVEKPRPIAVLWENTLSREYLNGVPPAKAPYVAIVTTDWVGAGSCGPYQAGYEMKYAAKQRWTAKARLHEAKTGKLVKQQQFFGSYPGECPYSVMVSGYGGSVSPIQGDANVDAVTTWLKAVQK